MYLSYMSLVSAGFLQNTLRYFNFDAQHVEGLTRQAASDRRPAAVKRTCVHTCASPRQFAALDEETSQMFTSRRRILSF